MAHVIHACPKAPDGQIESLKRTYGWAYDDQIPLNADKHESCPYCGKPTSEMERAAGTDVVALNRPLNGSRVGSSRASNAGTDALIAEVRELRKAVASLKGGAQ